MSNVSLSKIRTWLSDVLDGDVPSWEVTPETVSILTTLYNRYMKAEADTEVMMEALKTARAEYEAETERLVSVLSRSVNNTKMLESVWLRHYFARM